MGAIAYSKESELNRVTKMGLKIFPDALPSLCTPFSKHNGKLSQEYIVTQALLTNLRNAFRLSDEL